MQPRWKAVRKTVTERRHSARCKIATLFCVGALATSRGSRCSRSTCLQWHQLARLGMVRSTMTTLTAGCVSLYPTRRQFSNSTRITPTPRASNTPTPQPLGGPPLSCAAAANSPSFDPRRAVASRGSPIVRSNTYFTFHFNAADRIRSVAFRPRISHCRGSAMPGTVCLSVLPLGAVHEKPLENITGN